MDEEVWLVERPVDSGAILHFSDSHSSYDIIMQFRQLKFDQLCTVSLNYASRTCIMHNSFITSQLSTCVQERVIERSTGTEKKKRRRDYF